MQETWTKLREPFSDDEIEWRVSRAGVKEGKGPWAVLVPYLTSRAIMNRLDDVVGPENWQDEYTTTTGGNENGFLCRLSVRVGGEWITKTDGAECSDIVSIKGGISDALKRTAVKFGMGRFLYDLDEVTVFSDQIIQGYPPKGNKNAVVITTSKDKGDYRGWCEAPKVSVIMGLKSLPNNPVPKPLTPQQERFKKLRDSGKLTPAQVEKMTERLRSAKGTGEQDAILDGYEQEIVNALAENDALAGKAF